jgi:tRNA threonylcarbamoyladenosine biosynthesis protein TsaE
LGFKAQVHSPTFALIHEYTGGRLPLFHIDLYRMESPSQVIGAGLEEYLYQPAGVTVVEWAERWAPPGSPLSPPTETAPLANYRCVMFETLSENERRITYE